jgi:hypothetical protein
LLVTASAVDLALNKSATQSNTFACCGYSFDAWRAVDGNTNGDFWGALSSSADDYGRDREGVRHAILAILNDCEYRLSISSASLLFSRSSRILLCAASYRRFTADMLLPATSDKILAQTKIAQIACLTRVDSIWCTSSIDWL